MSDNLLIVGGSGPKVSSASTTPATCYATTAARYAGNLIAAWSLRYIVDLEQGGLAPKDPDEGVVVSIGRDRFRTDVRAAGHVIVADEPVEVGGGGLGPSPYDLLLASLGTCTAITLRM